MLNPKYRRESGNVLWFLLLAIALLGILTMVLSRSGSKVDQSGDVEQARIKAGQIMRYGKSIEAAIENMILNGISENDISFENSTTATDYINANCTIQDCLLFNVEGAGLSYTAPPSGTNDGSEWIFTAANNVGTTADPIGNTASITGNDLIMLLPNASTSMCEIINRDMGVGSGGSIPADATGITTAEFTGAYPNTLNIIDGDPTPFELDGKTAGCVTDTAADPDITYFYYVLLAR